MTRSISAENAAALQARQLMARDFIWFVVRDGAGAPVNDGYWSDFGTITADVINPETGLAQAREFFGAASLIAISAITLSSDITVQRATVTLSQCADRVNELIRGYDCKQARVEIFRGMYNTDTRGMVAPAVPRFVGFIDHIEIKTPSENEQGAVVLTCVSHTQEMTRSNTDTRSDASQKRRSATDNFYQDTATVGSQEFFWGKASGSIDADKPFGQPAGK